MVKRIFVGIILVLLLIGMLALAFNVKPVRASGTIYIRADGSIEGTTNIQTIDNVTYSFVADINDSIIVQKDNIVVDGGGYALQGPWNGTGFAPEKDGIDLSYRTNVTVRNVQIEGFRNGISLSSSSHNSISGNNMTNNTSAGVSLYSSSSYNSISGNNMTNNGQGISLDSSPNDNSIGGNNITNNGDGIWLYSSSYNSVSGNNITYNEYGIWLYSSSDNSISGNNIANNGNGIRFYSSSNYNSISGNNITNNECGIQYLYGSSENRFYHNNFINNTQQVNFYSSGYANFWDDGYPSGGNSWSDYNGTDADHDGIGDTPYVIDANNTDNYPFMTSYVVPEFPSFLILPLFFIATLLAAVIVYRRKKDR